MTERLNITSLDQLRPPTITVEVTLADGNVAVIPMRALTYFEWHELGYAVPQPVPPTTGAGPDGPRFDRTDGNFLIACAKADIERDYRRLAKALQIPVHGDSIEAKAETLKGALDASITRQLISILQQQARAGEARIAERAATFPAAGDGGAAGVSGVGDQAGSVADAD